MVPSFSDDEELEELLQWISDTTIDPVTGTLYPDALMESIWIPYRFDSFNRMTKKCFFYTNIPIKVILRWKDNLKITIVKIWWILI